MKIREIFMNKLSEFELSFIYLIRFNLQMIIGLNNFGLGTRTRTRKNVGVFFKGMESIESVNFRLQSKESKE